MNICKAAACAALSLLWSACAPAAEPAKQTAAGIAALSKTKLPARGRQESILTISRFGRYAITVASDQGVSLQLVDRMAGPGEISGKAGEKDGRLDLFLDRGDYKVVARAHWKGTGTMTLAVREFVEQNRPQPPRLVELKRVDAALDDFSQLSYWIEVSERRPAAFEAGGRNLADLRLWKDGDWLVDAEPQSETVQPRVGQPLSVRRLAATLEPGLYLLTAYGGPSLPWAEDSANHPFTLRFGIPPLSDAGRRRYTAGPLGIDRFLVPGNVTYFRLELPEARPAEMTVGDFDPQNPFSPAANRALLTKQSLPPVAELSANRLSDKLHIVTVTTPADQPYLLQHFEAMSHYVFSKGGDYWLSTIHSGDPADSVDATAIVLRQRRAADGHDEPLVEQVVDLDSKTGWATRCNLLEPLTVFVHVQEAAKYEIRSKGAEARFRFEPFFTYRPPRYKPPDFQRSGSVWNLDAGYYVLTVKPEKKGILEMLVRPAGLTEFDFPTAKAEGPQARSGRAAAQFPSLRLDSQFTYHVFVNDQPQVKSGLVVRPLPVDLSEELTVVLRPAESISVPVRAAEPGTITCLAEDGAALDVSVDGGRPAKGANVLGGTHTVSIQGTLPKTAIASLGLTPIRLVPSTPLPVVTEATLAELPKFPVLTETAPAFFDLARDQTASFLVNAEQPALYRLETTGLLSTSGNLRSRIVTSFLKDSANGVGRNFLIQSYLRSGDYQLSVSPNASSVGHIGLKLARTPLFEGGALTNGIPVRGELPTGQAIVYTFKISTAGQYTAKAMGLGHQFRGRLEDVDGWPIVAPNGPADYTRRFETGSYRLVVLPEPMPSRVVTLLQRRQPALKFAGHGPHKLPLARRVEQLWMEPASGQQRVPDAWLFDLPAPGQISLELTDEMNGDLFRIAVDGSAEKIAHVPPLSGWKGPLEKGRYRLEASCVRPNSSLPYKVAVWPEPLMAGLVRNVTAPISIPVSVGAEGLVEISSFGSTDVRGRLYDAEGRPVASNDDRPGDWNFLLAGRLVAGTYRLAVDPVGASQAVTTISMNVPGEVVEKVLVPPFTQTVSPGNAVHVYSLETGSEARFLGIAAQSAENVGLSLEVEDSGSWRSLGSRIGRSLRLETPVNPGMRHRLRFWSADRRAVSARLSAFVVSPGTASESQLAAGVALSAAGGRDTGVAAVRVERPGLFRVESDRKNLRACSTPERLCDDVEEGGVPALTGALWFVKELGTSSEARVRASRVLLPSGADHAVIVTASPERPVVCDLASGKPGPVLVTARSIGGQPGVAVLTGTDRTPDAREMAVGVRCAVAASLTGARATRVWAADRGAETLEARVTQQRYPPPARESGTWGSLSGSLSGLAARSFELPAGGKRVRLAVGEATVAVLSEGDEVSSVHWANDEKFEETVEGSATRLTLLHTRAAEDRFSIETLPLATPELAPALSRGVPFEQMMERAGFTRLEIPAEPDPQSLRLHVRGADGEPILLSARGEVSRGTDLDVGREGGTVLVPHSRGVLLAWLDRADAPGEGVWGDVKSPPMRAVTVPAVVTLEGAAQILRLAPSGPVLLHLRSATPLVTRWKRGGAPAIVEAYPSGCDFDVYWPGGPAEIGLRALSGRTLWGSAELTSTPVVPTGEGLGPEVLLSAGGTRGFSFEVTRNGPVGLGARADSDVIETTLWTSGGEKVGSGVVQMPQLSPGSYVLAIHAPPGSRPVRARPAVAGLKPPSLDPPDEVIQSYIAPPEEGPSFSATRRTARRVAPQETTEEPAEGETEEEPDSDDGGARR